MSLANGAHQEDIPMFVKPGLHYDVILGMPWLKRHQPKIKWDSESVTFNSETCQNHCLESNNGFPIIIFSCQSSQKMFKPIPVQELFQPLENTLIPIGAIAFQHLASKPDHKIYSVSLRDIEQALKPKAKTNPATVLPEHYKKFLKVFSYEEANKLPPHHPGVDHIIKMQPGTQPPAGPLYGMSRNELQVLKKYLKKNLSKGFIWASSLPAAAPVLFVKKHGGGLWFCVDYRVLNALTVTNKYTLPLIKETLDRLCKAVYFTKLNIVAVFNKICMAKGKE